jgi:uncharacterized protein (DUF1499 family)
MNESINPLREPMARSATLRASGAAVAGREACLNITMRTFLIFLLLPGLSLLASAAGPGDSDLPPCPSSPNCVSSRDPDPARRVDPIPFLGPAEEAREALETVLRSQPRATIVASSGIVVRAEFRTRLGFVDDVEFRIDEAAREIHVRSASRKGYWDLGVNRRRVEAIRDAFVNVMEQRRGGGPGNR